jgi:hypothetical protein
LNRLKETKIWTDSKLVGLIHEATWNKDISESAPQETDLSFKRNEKLARHILLGKELL